uniref:Uncharacterized protein n=1 Tax=Molossus molossus TaxID=27622 RepID=A0A7J8FYU7_MOLMO|nr:hypothetical protein HJG59_008250 [Molossus molossus]
MTLITAPAHTLAWHPSAGYFCTTICGTEWGSGRDLEKVSQAGDKGKDLSTETSPSFPRSSMSPKCSISSAPSIGTGSPICSKGAGRSRNRQPTEGQMPEIVGFGEGPLPTRHPLGHILIFRQQKLGTSGSQWSLCPSPCLWTPAVARWLSEKGELPTGFQGLGEGQRCQPLGPSPILFASKFLSNTFWGFPQPPNPDLSWKVWVPLFLPWEGLKWDRKLGVFRALCGEGSELLQGMVSF